MSVGSGITIGGDYNWQQSAFAGQQAASEATGWLYARLSSTLGMTVHGGTGFNANSADLFGGVSLSLRF